MTRFVKTFGAAATLAFATAAPLAAQTASPPPPANDQMQAVLDQLEALGAKPLGTIGVEEARTQPTPADAVAAVMAAEGIEPDPALDALAVRDIAIPGPAGEIAARTYTPEGEGPFPVIVYYHGGGWVIADLDTYDASARALAHGAEAIVVASHYRQAPEHRFPAGHEDAYAAYAWTVENLHQFNGDAGRIALAGESAGGNLAVNVALEARERQATEPGHMLLVYPVAGVDMMTESYVENAEAAPLGKAGMEWFVGQVFADPSEAMNPRINLVERDDLAGLPPTTVVTAQIDPLRSEGQLLAERLEAAGVPVEARTYEGVAHEFFGMGAVVDEAREAMEFAVGHLRETFAADSVTE